MVKKLVLASTIVLAFLSGSWFWARYETISFMEGLTDTLAPYDISLEYSDLTFSGFPFAINAHTHNAKIMYKATPITLDTIGLSKSLFGKPTLHLENAKISSLVDIHIKTLSLNPESLGVRVSYEDLEIDPKLLVAFKGQPAHLIVKNGYIIITPLSRDTSFSDITVTYGGGKKLHISSIKSNGTLSFSSDKAQKTYLSQWRPLFTSIIDGIKTNCTNRTNRFPTLKPYVELLENTGCKLEETVHVTLEEYPITASFSIKAVDLQPNFSLTVSIKDFSHFMKYLAADDPSRSMMLFALQGFFPKEDGKNHSLHVYARNGKLFVNGLPFGKMPTFSWDDLALSTESCQGLASFGIVEAPVHIKEATVPSL